MKRLLIAFTLAAMPLLAQQPASAKGDKPVAIVDGEVITAAKLDWMWDHLPDDLRIQYSQSSGKAALLDNYIRKRLVIHEAEKSGYAKRPDVRADVDAAKESTLFDRYIRDIVSQRVVTDSAMKQYYEQHLADFAEPEAVKLRHIVIGVTNTGRHPHTDEQAMEIAQKALTDVMLTIPRSADPAAAVEERAAKFAALARAYSEDPSGPAGGDLGWVTRTELDTDLVPVAFSIPIGVPSGIVKSRYGYHIIFVEARRPAGTTAFEDAKPRIREAMLKDHVSEIVAALNKLTDDLSAKARIEVHPENIR